MGERAFGKTILEGQGGGYLPPWKIDKKATQSGAFLSNDIRYSNEGEDMGNKYK